MIRGITIAIIVSFIWILVQNIIIRFWSIKNRLKVMFTWFALSLPFIHVLYYFMPLPYIFSIKYITACQEKLWIGLFHSYFLHLLIFFFYVECYFHIDRAVTLRLLCEIYISKTGYISISDLQNKYDLHNMVRRRLEILNKNGYIVEDSGYLKNTEKGNFFATIMFISSWIFQSKSQLERN